MLYENWLHTGSLDIKTPYCPPLKENIKTDCLVIGGGFTGLHAALRLVDGGKKVVLIEKRICGGDSSGESAGFLTPESEEDLTQIIETYGEEKGKLIYNVPLKGVQLIINTAKKYKFNCDLRKQDSFYFSTRRRDDKLIKEEAKYKEESGLPFGIYKKDSLKKIHPGEGYRMGLRYPGSYGMNSFAYCQEMKNLLIKKGVKIYEDSEVHKLEGNTAKTHLGSATAKNILICVNKMKPKFNEDIPKKLYHIQTYLAVSESLSNEEMKSIFPKGELMCWDTSLIYIHYRPVLGNRIIVGGSSPWAAYHSKPIHSPRIINRFIEKLKKAFPKIKNVEFTHYWSGMIDVTKDLIPITDYDKENKSIQYTIGCAGLNWAAYCGDYMARRLLNPKGTEDLTEFLGSNRKFFLSDGFQKIFGKKITFALSHLKQFFS